MKQTTNTRLGADALNAHLTAGGLVQVTTYTKSTIYQQRNAGDFTEDKAGNLRVRQGRSTVCLSQGQSLLVGIRLGRYTTS